MGEWRYSSIILDLSTRWRWVVIFTPRPLYLRGKSPRHPLHSPNDGLDAVEQRKIFPLLAIEIRLLSRQARNLSLYRLIYPTLQNHDSKDQKIICIRYVQPADLRWLERWHRRFESHSRHGRLYCAHLFYVCVVLCVGSGLAAGCYPYRLCIGSKIWKSVQGPTKGCTAIIIIIIIISLIAISNFQMTLGCKILHQKIVVSILRKEKIT
jgi:hypothetical protein